MSGSCAHCRGQCCYNALIRVTGADIRRIARSQRLEPAAFVEAVPDTRPADDDFALAFGLGSPPVPHLLVLRHSARVAGACTFLLLLANHQPCGMYADRPLVCRLYPMDARRGGIAVRDDVICRPEYWEADTIDEAAWRAIAAQRDLEWRTYERIVRVWNAEHEASWASGVAGYFAYLDAAYDELERNRAALPRAPLPA